MNDAAPATTELAPDRVAELIEAGAELIDVRRRYEFDAGRIPGARNVEMNELSAAAGSITREAPVVFYCRSGNRSQMAAQAFAEAGYDAHNLAEGIQGWVDAGRPLEPEDGEVAAAGPPSAEDAAA